MKKLRILALVHDHLVPPEDTTGIDVLEAEWKMEYDVIETLREMGHSVRVLGLHDELGSIRPTVGLFKPHIVFNLMEAFAGVTTFDQNVVSYLELLRLPYTGCNPRGLILARDKSLSKKLLAYHRIGIPDFIVVRRGRPAKLEEADALSAHREIALLRGLDRHFAGVGRRKRGAARAARAVHSRQPRTPPPSSSSSSTAGSCTWAWSAISGSRCFRCGRCRSRRCRTTGGASPPNG